MSAIKIDATCPMCDNWSGQWDNMAGWTCLVCAYTGSPETFLGWSGSVDNIAPPEAVPEQDCRRCRYFLPPDPKFANYKQSESVMSCEVCIRPRNFETFAPCGIFKPKAEPPAKVNEFVVPGGLTGPINVKPGSVISCSTHTPKGEPMKIKRFIVRSFLRSFRHSLFILAIWKAAELVHWAWPGLRMAGRMLYPPLYEVAHAIAVWRHNEFVRTSGSDVCWYWVGIIVIAAGAIALLCAAWYFLNRLARAAFIEAVK